MTSINKLILFVSEACNLRCSYCYVMLSDEQYKKNLMSSENAKTITRSIFENYNNCNFIQFFGGEPTLNIHAMNVVVSEIKKMFSNGEILKMPRFGIVTNGASKYMKEAISFCKENNVAVTVSLDGPSNIHNQLRHSIKGKDTFDVAVSTIKDFLESNIPVAIETVYTSRHIDEQISLVNLFEFFLELDIKKFIIHTAYPPAPQELCPFDDNHFDKLCNYHIEAVDWWFKSLIDDNGRNVDIYFKDILVPILKGTIAAGGCPAGIHDFAVGPDGDVYSCHLLYKDPKFYLGNIINDEQIKHEKSLPVLTNDIKQCSECFARYWCQTCGALNLSWGSEWIPFKRECKLRKTVLLRIGLWSFKYLSVPENDITNVLREAVYQHYSSEQTPSLY